MTLATQSTPPLLLNPKEVATLIGFGRNKTYKLIRAGEIPSIRIGGRLRVPREALDDWVRSLPLRTTRSRVRSPRQ